MKLVVFGDSWPYGDELVDPARANQNCHSLENESYRLSHGYPGLIAQHFGLELVNLARCGNSLQGMQYALSWWSHQPEYNDSFMLFSLPFMHRMSWINPEWHQQGGSNFLERLWHSSWIKQNSVDVDSDIKQLHQIWTARVSSALQDFHHVNIAANFFAGFCHMRSIPYLMHHVFDEAFQADFTDPELTLETILLNTGLFHANGHPNELGHKMIAEKLIYYIKHNKLLG